MFLSINKLCFSYQKNEDILSNLSLELKHGDIVGIMGQSGCGKSTLLKIISGFLNPSKGNIILHGQPMSSFKPSQRPSSMVFQDYALFTKMSVRENIEFGLKVRKIEKAVRLSTILELLDLLDLQKLENVIVDNLSGGQKQRVALARSLAVNPELLLLDEPLSALDKVLKTDFYVLFRKILKERKITTIMVSHSFDDISAICDNLSIWTNKKLTKTKSIKNWIENPEDEKYANLLGFKNILYHNSYKYYVPKESIISITMNDMHVENTKYNYFIGHIVSTRWINNIKFGTIKFNDCLFETAISDKFEILDNISVEINLRLAKEIK